MPLVPDPKNCDISVKRAIQGLSKKLGYTASPTYVNITLTDLTASSLVGTNASKLLESVTIGTGLDYTRPTLSLSHLGIEALTDPGADRIFFWDNSASASEWLAVGNSIVITTTTIDTIQDIRTSASPTFTGLTLSGLTDDSLIYPSSGVLTSLGVATNGQLPIGSTGTTPVLATISGTTDHISVSNGAGSVTLDLDTNTQTLLGSFNGIFLEKIDFTISEAGGTVTGSLEQDGGGDLIQKFSDGYTTLDCTPAKTIDLTAYVGTNAVPKLVFVYILQSNKTTLVASNSDWPATEHNKIARLLLKSAVTTGTDGGALVNQNWNDYAFDATGEGHVLDIEHRLRQEPAQYEDGLALTLKNSAGAALTTGNSSTAVELVTTEGRVFQLHIHVFPSFDMYSVGTDFAQIANQVVDEGGAYVTTADLVTDITRYVDGSDAGAAIGVNKYFNLVIWGVMNREGEASHIMINLPTGQYTTSANAVADIDGTSTFDIPFAFKGTGFLIARLTFRLIAGAEWTYIAIEDLRGQTPVVSAGVGISTTDHALLANLTAPADDHTQYLLADGTRALAGAWDMGSQALTNVNIDSGVITGITDLAVADGGTGASNAGDARTNLGLVIGTNVQAYDAELTSLAALSYVAASFVKMTGANTFALRTIGETADDLEGTIDHNSLANYAANQHYLQSAITTVGTIATGVWEGTDVGIAHGGTGQSTAQLAINALSAVSGATNEHVLTKDTGTGNALWKAAAGGGASTFVALTDTPANYTSQAKRLLVVNEAANAVVFASNLYWNETDDRLGIGESVPLSPLHVTNATATWLYIEFTDNSSYSGIRFAENASITGSIYVHGSNYIIPADRYSMNIQSHSGDLILNHGGVHNVAIGTKTPVTLLTVEGTLTLKEQAAADGDTAAYGQIWVKSDAPNTLWFTDDGGTDHQLAYV